MAAQWVSWEYFLTPSEKDELAAWEEPVVDKTIFSAVWGPIFDLIAGFFPSTMAPNVLLLIGSAGLLQSWYFCETYAAKFPAIATLVATLAIFSTWALSGLADALHRRLKTVTPLSELFSYACHAVGQVFFALTLCSLLTANADSTTQWYCVQTVQLVLLCIHYRAFTREAGVSYFFLMGSGEAIFLAMSLLVIRGASGLTTISAIYEQTWGRVCSMTGFAMPLPRAAYLGSLYITLSIILVTSGKRIRPWSKAGLVWILALKGLGGRLAQSLDEPLTTRDAICDGLFMAVVVTDLIAAKMAKRDFHQMIVFVTLLTIVPHMHAVTLGFVAFYLFSVFEDLKQHTNLPLFQMVRTVYCDGIYDMNHIGHKNAFRNAMKLGNRLFVGVVGDTDANNYKRPPIMSAAERENEVRNCKCVTKVIGNAPCFGMTLEFIKKHGINVMVFGQEYQDRYPNPDDDPYYKIPRKMGIAVPVPRTDGMSTSDLIHRIQSRALDSKKSPT